MSVRSQGPGVALLAALSALGLAGAAAAASGPDLKANLSGRAERPTPGDPRGSGFAFVTVDRASSRICYIIQTKDIGPATMASLHKGPSSGSGGVVVELRPPGSSGRSEGCENIDEGLVQELSDSPEDFYVNVHTSAYPGGAVRGQLNR